MRWDNPYAQTAIFYVAKCEKVRRWFIYTAPCPGVLDRFMIPKERIFTKYADAMKCAIRMNEEEGV